MMDAGLIMKVVAVVAVLGFYAFTSVMVCEMHQATKPSARRRAQEHARDMILAALRGE